MDLKRTRQFEERLLKFSIEIVRTAKSEAIDRIYANIYSQMTRSATSIGANYSEAINSESQKDFRHKIGISRKEAKETLYWIDIALETYKPSVELKTLRDECLQLVKIFSSIYKNSAK